MTFRNPYLSYSRIQKFVDCPRAFKRHYIDGDKGPATDPMRNGSLIHAVLEHIVKAKDVSHAAVDAVYPQLWAESGLRAEASYKDALDICHAWVDRWHEPDVMGVEESIEILLGDGRSVKCYIDRIDRLSSDTVEVVDYKSSRRPPLREDVEDSLQLAIYSLAVRSKYRWANSVKVTLDMVRYGTKVSVWRTLEQDLRTLAYLRMIGPVTESSDYAPCINGNCGSCPHRHDCPAYAEVLANMPTLEAIPEEHKRAKAIAKIATKRGEEIREIIRAELMVQDAFEAGGMRYGLAETVHKSYPLTATIDTLEAWSTLSRGEILERVATVGKSKLKKFLETLPPEARDAVDAVADVSVGRRITERKA